MTSFAWGKTAIRWSARSLLVLASALALTGCSSGTGTTPPSPTGLVPLFHVTAVTGSAQSPRINIEYVGGPGEELTGIDLGETAASVSIALKMKIVDDSPNIALGVICHTTATLKATVGDRRFVDAATGEDVMFIG